MSSGFFQGTKNRIERFDLVERHNIQSKNRLHLNLEVRVKRVIKSSFIATISLIKFEITLKLCIRESFHYDKDVSKILDCLSISDTIFCKLAINSGTFECQVSWSGIPTRLSLNLEDFSEVKALQIWPFSHFHDGWMMEKSC